MHCFESNAFLRGDQDDIMSTSTNVSLCLRRKGNFMEAIKEYEYVKNEYETRHLQADMVYFWTLQGIGECWTLLKEFDMAMIYHEKAFHVSFEIGDGLAISTAALELGITLWEMRNFNTENMTKSALWMGKATQANQASSVLNRGIYQMTHLHMAYIEYTRNNVQEALGHMASNLNDLVEYSERFCASCYQFFNKKVKLLKCGRCKTARFCNEKHQRVAFSNVQRIQHKKICVMLMKWTDKSTSVEQRHEVFFDKIS